MVFAELAAQPPDGTQASANLADAEYFAKWGLDMINAIRS